MTTIPLFFTFDEHYVVPALDAEFTTGEVLAMGFVEGQPIESLVVGLFRASTVRPRHRLSTSRPTRSAPTRRTASRSDRRCSRGPR